MRKFTLFSQMRNQNLLHSNLNQAMERILIFHTSVLSLSLTPFLAHVSQHYEAQTCHAADSRTGHAKEAAARRWQNCVKTILTILSLTETIFQKYLGGPIFRGVITLDRWGKMRKKTTWFSNTYIWLLIAVTMQWFSSFPCFTLSHNSQRSASSS